MPWDPIESLETSYKIPIKSFENPMKSPQKSDLAAKVKEAHQLLESFATWASKTEAALTLFVPWRT